jgi:hypothetical protein
LTTHLRTEGLSRRAYARQRGCSEAAVRQAIADGRLKPALLPDGSIDGAKADGLLAESTISGKEPPSELSAARQQKLRAQCALLRDEIAAVEKSLIAPDEARAASVQTARHVAGRLRRMAAEIAPKIVGKGPVEISATIQEHTHAALTDLAATRIIGTKDATRKAKPRILAKMTATELAAMKTTLQARRLELQIAQRDSKLLDLGLIGQAQVKRFMAVRTKVLALHHQMAPRLEGMSLKEARASLGNAVEEMIDELVCDMVPAAMLLPEKASS